MFCRTSFTDLLLFSRTRFPKAILLGRASFPKAILLLLLSFEIACSVFKFPSTDFLLEGVDGVVG